MALGRLYLALARVLFLSLKTLHKSTYKQVYSSVKNPHLYAQAALLLEILNATFLDAGEVGLQASTIRYLVTSRVFVTLILYFMPENRTHFSVSCFVISWSIIETTRYSFYGTKQVFGFAPLWLVSLRYDTFIPLYLIAVGSGDFLIYSYMCKIIEENNYSCTVCLVGSYTLERSIDSIFRLWSYVFEQREKALLRT